MVGQSSAQTGAHVPHQLTGDAVIAVTDRDLEPILTPQHSDEEAQPVCDCPADVVVVWRGWGGHSNRGEALSVPA